MNKHKTISVHIDTSDNLDKKMLTRFFEEIISYKIDRIVMLFGGDYTFTRLRFTGGDET